MSTKTKTKYEIQKIVVFSTTHITEGDNNRLEYEATFKNESSSLIVDKFEYGYYIHIPSEFSELIHIHSEALQNLLMIAKDIGCQYLKLDRDGQTYENIETYDW